MCVSRKVVTGECGWVHLKSANSMADLGLIVKSPWFEPGRSFSCFMRKQSSHLV